MNAQPISPSIEIPTKTHRLSRLRAELIGRKTEMSKLEQAVEHLKQGRALIFSITGDAGTGKSRLLEEFRGTLDLDDIQWREGHAYDYTRNIPYFPLIDLLNRAWQIREGDSPGQVKHKIEAGVTAVIEDRLDLIPYIGNLYSLSYAETENISPELWKSRLHEAIRLILANLFKRRPTVVCIEDLHWADPSSIELLRNTLIHIRNPMLFIFIFRPSFSLFSSHQIAGMEFYNEIRIHDLSPADAHGMVKSLLKTNQIPSSLKSFILEKVEGNPFFLEEIINSLIETEVLIRCNGSWELKRPVTEKDIPGTVHGIITARLDRLDGKTRHILQEASVIGRAFSFEVLKKISNRDAQIDKYLQDLESLDFIRTRSLQPDLDYIFKHALTREVVYNGILKEERQQIHVKIGLAIESLYHDRLHEFYETLAYHFREGQSLHKAVDYLMKAGEKSRNRYSLDEAHRTYQEAFHLISNKPDRSTSENELLIDIFNNWSLIQYLRGRFGDMQDLLIQYKETVELIDDKARKGMFYGWIGLALHQLEKNAVDAYDYFKHSLSIGEELKDDRIIGYACTFLVWSCAELGRLDEGGVYGKRALELARKFTSDHWIFAVSRGGMATINLYKGLSNPNFDLGKELINHGRSHSDVRAMFVGYMCCGYGYFARGDFASAIASFKHAVDVAVDPFYRQWASFWWGYCCLEMMQISEAEKALREVIVFDESYGSKQLGTPARSFWGAILVSNGKLARGLSMMAEARDTWLKSGRKFTVAVSDYNFGKIYSQLAGGGQNVTFSMVAKNIGFLLKNVPFAARKAEKYYQSAIRQWRESGSTGWAGRASLDLGRLYKMKGRKEQARKSINDAVSLFEECEAECFLDQARKEMASL